MSGKSLVLGFLVCLAAVPTYANGSKFARWDPSRGWIINGSSMASVAPQGSDPASGTAGSGTPAVETQRVAEAAPVTPAPQVADAYLNMTSGPYPNSSALTTGTPQDWVSSPVVTNAFGHVPNPQEQADFVNTILQHVEQTFLISNPTPSDPSYNPDHLLSVNLTTNPNDLAFHTISVVSDAQAVGSPNAIGIANMPGNGFSFIDKFGFAHDVNSLEWALAHNIAHELMHALGVDHQDTTGTYLDGPVATTNQLMDPNFRFSPKAVQALLAEDVSAPVNLALNGGLELVGGAPEATVPGPQPVPEPTTLVIWGLITVVGAWRVQTSRCRVA